MQVVYDPRHVLHDPLTEGQYGEPLPISQNDIQRAGWAIECRINAEDPFRGFLPSTGRLVRFLSPDECDGAVRVDTGVQEGGEISIHYDSMIAKLITHGKTRSLAIDRMRDALNAFVIRGISSNIPFQAALLQHPQQVTLGVRARVVDVHVQAHPQEVQRPAAADHPGTDDPHPAHLVRLR